MSIRALAMTGYALALGSWIVLVGLPSDPFQMFVWLWLAAIAWYAGSPWSVHLQFVRDWWPAFAVLVLYLYSRGLSDELIGMPVHWTMPIDVDRWMFGGNLPTEVLQDRLCGDPCLRSDDPRWYDVLLTTVYFSHFVLGLGLAFVLWIRDRAAWTAWLTRYLAINVAGLVIYVLYPMAPPWLAAKEGYIDESLPGSPAAAGRSSGSTGSTSCWRRSATPWPRCRRCTPASRRWWRSGSSLATGHPCGG